MGQPVKISAELLLDARQTGGILKRSIAGQIEFWALLGRAIEPLLEGAQVMALQESGKVQPLSACLDMVDTPSGRRRVRDFLKSRPFPHFEPAPDRAGLLHRTDAKGRKSLGRFIGRQFKVCR